MPKIDSRFWRRFAAIYGLAIYFKLQSYNSNTMIIIILSWFYNCFTLSAILTVTWGMQHYTWCASPRKTTILVQI